MCLLSLRQMKEVGLLFMGNSSSSGGLRSNFGLKVMWWVVARDCGSGGLKVMFIYFMFIYDFHLCNTLPKIILFFFFWLRSHINKHKIKKRGEMLLGSKKPMLYRCIKFSFYFYLFIYLFEMLIQEFKPTTCGFGVQFF